MRSLSVVSETGVIIISLSTFQRIFYNINEPVSLRFVIEVFKTLIKSISFDMEHANNRNI